MYICIHYNTPNCTLVQIHKQSTFLWCKKLHLQNLLLVLISNFGESVPFNKGIKRIIWKAYLHYIHIYKRVSEAQFLDAPIMYQVLISGKSSLKWRDRILLMSDKRRKYDAISDNWIHRSHNVFNYLQLELIACCTPILPLTKTPTRLKTKDTCSVFTRNPLHNVVRRETLQRQENITKTLKMWKLLLWWTFTLVLHSTVGLLSGKINLRNKLLCVEKQKFYFKNLILHV